MSAFWQVDDRIATVTYPINFSNKHRVPVDGGRYRSQFMKYQFGAFLELFGEFVVDDPIDVTGVQGNDLLDFVEPHFDFFNLVRCYRVNVNQNCGLDVRDADPVWTVSVDHIGLE